MAANLSIVLFDQVVRKQRFQAAHPDILIELHTAPLWHWRAALPDGRELTDHGLSGLLDALTRTLETPDNES